jgi:hypothetical protein
MKKNFLFLMAAFAAAGLNAQSKGTIGLYAYEQPVVGGMVQKEVSEDGTTQEKPAKPRFNYLVYTVSNSTITPVEIWIKGVGYSVKAEPASTPVEMRQQTGGKKTLVPKTGKRVLQLSLYPLTGSGNAKAKKLGTSNGVVLVYKANGKSFYQSLGKIVRLEPAFLE